MKKLIIAAAIVCAAVVSQAASVGWTSAGATDYANGSYSLFVIGLNGVESASQIAAIVEAGGLSNADGYAFYKGGSVNNSGAASLTADKSGKAITYKPLDPSAVPPVTEADNTYEAFLVVVNSDGTAGSYSGTKSITLENDATGKAWSFANQKTNYTANKFEIGSVPEPTSGLLLLIGVAGLALKRKRA